VALGATYSVAYSAAVSKLSSRKGRGVYRALLR
jgi:hypothetical protein